MRYRWFLIAAGSVLILLLAYLLREVVNEKIVIPFSYLWWRLGLYYHAIEEETWLVLTVGMISILAYLTLVHIIVGGSRIDYQEWQGLCCSSAMVKVIGTFPVGMRLKM